MAREKCACGGGRHQHDNDAEGCWCYQCMKKQDRGDRRCQGFVSADPAPAARPAPLAAVEEPAAGQKTPASDVAETGTLRREIFEAVRASKQVGMTEDDLEQALERTAQSVAGARHTLMKDGHVVDSGRRRKNRHGADAIVWVTPFYR